MFHLFFFSPFLFYFHLFLCAIYHLRVNTANINNDANESTEANFATLPSKPYFTKQAMKTPQ